MHGDRHDVRQPAVRRARRVARRTRAFTRWDRRSSGTRMFPERTNVEFAAVEQPDRVRILIWERGVGPTRVVGHRILRVADCRGGVRRRASATPRSWRRAGRSASSGATTASTSPAGAEILCDGRFGSSHRDLIPRSDPGSDLDDRRLGCDWSRGCRNLMLSASASDQLLRGVGRRRCARR